MREAGLPRRSAGRQGCAKRACRAEAPGDRDARRRVQKKFKIFVDRHLRFCESCHAHGLEQQQHYRNMRKTLLIAAAALAAGVISSNAQVYSQNIVGYVNTPIPTGSSFISIPLSNPAGNSMTNTIPNSGQLDGAVISIYNGHGFTQYTFDSSMSTGFGDAADLNPVAAPVIAPGTAFYINNNTGVALTNTFVGVVAVSALPGSATNNLVAGNTYASSIIPFGGGITTSLQFTNVSGALDGTVISQPNIVGGSIHGFIQSVFDSSMATGFGDASDLNPVSEPQIPVGGGFIFNNNAGAGTIQWVQSL